MMQLKSIFTSALVALVYVSQACPVCEKQQPKLLRGITHGAGPQSGWDWVIVGVIAVITLAVLALSLMCLIRPRERNDSAHIKYLPLSHQ